MQPSPAASPSSSAAGAWPSLPHRDRRDTCATLHLWTQMIGKTRLALAPYQNHWWHVPLYVTARGLTTSPMPFGTRTVEIDLDLIDHLLVARTSDGMTRTLALEPGSIAAFYARYRSLLDALGLAVRIWPVPSEVADPVPFAKDEAQRAYDPVVAHDLWRALVQADRVLKRFRGSFLGKCSPVHFWWGAFDLACTRFSGRRAPRHPGGVPGLPDAAVREAYSHECISAGWWPGSADGPIREPAFYAYIYPEPPGCAAAAMRPPAAEWSATLHEWLLPYAAVRSAPDPDAMLLEFLERTYEAAAALGGWDRAALDRAPTGAPIS